MPLFDFRCLACGHVFEALVRTGHATVCPSCGGDSLEKQISAPAVSSPERRGAAAAQAGERNAAIGGRDNAIRDREAKEHRKHEH
jgi:putative FmdB family regulatory protein